MALGLRTEVLNSWKPNEALNLFDFPFFGFIPCFGFSIAVLDAF